MTNNDRVENRSELELRFSRVGTGEDWPVPQWRTPGAAGMDLAAAVIEPVTLEPGRIALIPTGWAVAIPEGYEGQVRPRSGLALKQGLTLVNSPGTIDWDYRGEIGLPMINLGPVAVTIQRGDRLAQLVINRIERPRLVVVSSLGETERGDGGFGSTGL